MVKEDILVCFDRDQQRRRAEDAALAEEVVRVRLGTTAGLVPLLTFFSRNKERVAVVALTEPRCVMYQYRQCGPTGDCKFTLEKMGEELRAEGFVPVVEPTAGETLEVWAKTPEWELGLAQTNFLSYWNTFSFKQRHDLCRQIDQAPSLPEALALGARLLKQELPGVSLY